MPVMDIDGTTKNMFGISIGGNRVDIRSNSGEFEIRNFLGIWRKVQTRIYMKTTDPTVDDDANDGYLVGDTWFNTLTNMYYICKDTTVGAAVWKSSSRKNIFIKTADPTVNDDNTQNYEIQDLWINKINKRIFVCEDTTTGAAVWTKVQYDIYTTTTDPTVSNDNIQGYIIGDLWINKSLDRLWVATDVTTGAAVWAKVQQDIKIDVVDPVVGNDQTQGYRINDVWFNSAKRRGFYAASVGTGAAVWNPLTGDRLVDLIYNEVSVSGPSLSTIVLTSSAFGKMHVCSGSTTFYLQLPTVTGNAGKFIGIRVTNPSPYMVVVTSGGNMIGDSSMKFLTNTEVLIVMCTGSTWIVVDSYEAKMAFSAVPSIVQSIPTGASTQLIFASEYYDYGNIYEVFTSQFSPYAPGFYHIVGGLGIAGMSPNRYATLVMAVPTGPGGMILPYPGAMSWCLTSVGIDITLNLSIIIRVDFTIPAKPIILNTYHNNPSARNTSISFTSFSACRIASL